MVRALLETVAEVSRIAAKEGIEAEILPTDELMVATNPAQLARAEAEVAHRHHWGETPEEVFMLGVEETRARVAIPGVMGSMVARGVARVQPAKLVRGLADAVERRGVRIAEGAEVTGLSKGRVETDRGLVRAPIILRATEGFTAGLPGHRREWLPLNSAQIITAPLSEEVWREIGWNGYEILGDFNNAYCYRQRTREGRVAVGGRGAPYRYGSRIDDRGAPDPETVRRLTRILRRHFPAANGAAVDHAWCGVLGAPRDWCATVGLDRRTGIGWAGGYLGVGVSTFNLAGRTLCDLALGRETALTRLPWVNRRVRRWEPEPLRWLGVHAMYRLLRIADRREDSRGGPPSRAAALGAWLTGRG